MHKDSSALPGIPRTLSQSIYNYLKDAIIGNQLQANQRIIEKEIAARFGVSTTPVREAVLRLGAEGYISIDSHRKAVVREISIKEIKDIYTVLAHLDSFAAGEAIGHISNQAKAELHAMTQQMASACRDHDADAFLEINGEIHERIWAELPNQVLRRTLLDVHGQLLRYTHARIKAYRAPRIMEASLAEHQDILEAIEKKDRKRIKSIIRRNWRIMPEALPIEKDKKQA